MSAGESRGKARSFFLATGARPSMASGFFRLYRHLQNTMRHIPYQGQAPWGTGNLEVTRDVEVLEAAGNQWTCRPA